MRPAQHLRHLLLLTAILLLAGVAPASAALPITFDTLSPGTPVTNQFAADRITFLDPAGLSGPPAVKTVGTKANSGDRVATTTCAGCEFDDREILIAFSTFADTVTLRAGIDASTPTFQTIQVLPLSASQVPLQTREVSLSSSDIRQEIIVNPPGTNNIAFLRLRVFNGWDLAIDDLTATFADSPVADIAVTAEASIRVRAGGQATIPVQLLRFNGSSGNVALSASALPAGVSAAFSPSPLTGSALSTTSTLTLTAAPNATLGTTTATVQVSPTGGDSVAPAPRSTTLLVTVEPAFSATLADSADVTPCVLSSATLFVTRARSGYDAPISMRVDQPDGYEVSPSEQLLEGGPGISGHAVPLTIRATRSDAPATGNVVVRLTGPGLPERTEVLRITRRTGTITSITPTIGSAPRALRPGTTVRIEGTGFCPGETTVRFGNEFADAPATVDPSGQSLTTVVPRLGTTGPLTVQMPGRAITSEAPFTVLTPRTTLGFAFANYDHPGVDLDALTELYGAEQTQISIDPCNPLPGLIPPLCPIPIGIPNPLTAIYIGISNASLSGAGSCFGISAVAERISSGAVPLSRFAPAGATTAFALRGASGPAPDLARQIRIWHSAQLSSSFLGYWIDTAAANVSNSGRGSRDVILRELRAGRHALIALRDGGGGHAILATDLRDTPDGGYEVDVWDPNLPHIADENTNAVTHRDRADASMIRVRPGGRWTFTGAFSRTWTGRSDEMVAAPLSVMGNRPKMPTDPNGFVTLLVPLAQSGATARQVTDGSGKRLLDDAGDLNTDPATRPKGAITPTLDGEQSRTMYAIADRTATLQLAGTGDGTTGAHLLAPGLAATITGLRTRAGSRDALRADGRRGRLTIEAGRGGTVSAQLARVLDGGAAGDQLGAKLRIAGGDRGSHAVQLTGGGLEYVNRGSGPATVTASLSRSGERGEPGEASLPALSVPAGGTLTGAPSSWRSLGASAVQMVVRDRRGRTVTRRTVRPRATPSAARRVSRVRVRVTKRADGTATHVANVRARFGRVPKGATVQVIAVVMRRGKVATSRQTITIPASRARGHRSFALPLRLTKGRSVVYASVVVQSGRQVASGRGQRTVTVR